jgi:transcriptional regulator with XRE-family HTH domain
LVQLDLMRIYSYREFVPPTRTVNHNGPAIRAFREIRGLSIAELARRVDITSQALSNIECENKRVSAALANRIARELTIEVAAILRDRDQPDPAPETALIPV